MFYKEQNLAPLSFTFTLLIVIMYSGETQSQGFWVALGVKIEGTSFEKKTKDFFSKEYDV